MRQALTFYLSIAISRTQLTKMDASLQPKQCELYSRFSHRRLTSPFNCLFQDFHEERARSNHSPKRLAQRDFCGPLQRSDRRSYPHHFRPPQTKTHSPNDSPKEISERFRRRAAPRTSEEIFLWESLSAEDQLRNLFGRVTDFLAAHRVCVFQ